MFKIFGLLLPVVLCTYSDALFAVSTDVKNHLFDVIQKSDNISDINNSNFADVEQEIYNLNPELVKQNSHKSTQERIQIYRSFVINKTFDWYKDYFQQKILERAIETRRALIKSDEGWRLANGDLDKPECFEQNPKSWCYKMPICPRPQGHENVFLYFSDSDILYWDDHADENLTYIYSILMDNDTQDMLFQTYANAGNYNYYFQIDNSDLEFNARYKNYTKKEFEKLQKKTDKEIKKIENDSDISQIEINRILKEKELLYKSHPNVKSTYFIMGKTHTLIDELDINNGVVNE